MGAKRRRVTMDELEERARQCVTEYLGKTPVGLPAGLSGEDFQRGMDAVVRGMMAAWAAGYFFGKDGV